MTSKEEIVSQLRGVLWSSSSVRGILLHPLNFFIRTLTGHDRIKNDSRSIMAKMLPSIKSTTPHPLSGCSNDLGSFDKNDLYDNNQGMMPDLTDLPDGSLADTGCFCTHLITWYMQQVSLATLNQNVNPYCFEEALLIR